MPRYEVITNDELTSAQKAELAREVTDVHVEVTGAPPSFVHVVFATTGRGNTFIAGEQRPETAVRGFIRSGRDAASVKDLLAGLSDRVGRVTGTAQVDIVVWLVEVPGSRIMEDGLVLPEPDEEDNWLAHGMR